jgi:predicted nucleic acid-binding protein
MVVVDASVAFKWFRAEPDSAAAERLAVDHDLAAPELVLAEVANAAWKAVRLGQLATAQLEAAVRALPRYIVLLEPLRPLAVPAAAIAHEIDHPVYDCFYLALAERHRITMVTADRRLLAGVAGTRWAPTVQPLG